MSAPVHTLQKTRLWLTWPWLLSLEHDMVGKTILCLCNFMINKSSFPLHLLFLLFLLIYSPLLPPLSGHFIFSPPAKFYLYISLIPAHSADCKKTPRHSNSLSLKSFPFKSSWKLYSWGSIKEPLLSNSQLQVSQPSNKSTKSLFCNNKKKKLTPWKKCLIWIEIRYQTTLNDIFRNLFLLLLGTLFTMPPLRTLLT